MSQAQTYTNITTLIASQRRSRLRSLWLWIMVFLLVVGAVVAVQMFWRGAPSAASNYVTEAVSRGDLAVRVAATGQLQPTNTVEVGSELSGLVDAVLVDDNDRVKKGQVLARLDTLKLRDQLTRSHATLKAAEAQLAQHEATIKESSASLDRFREVWKLSGGRVPSRSEMDTAEAALARAEAQKQSALASVSEARATISSNETDLSKASIRSPVDGIVLKRSVDRGQTVAASLQVATLFTIAEDLRKMELEVAVDEADVGRVNAGQEATFTVDAYPNRTYHALVRRVAFGSTTSADVVSYAATLTVANDDLTLRPGMTASAEIATTTVSQALRVPNAALRFTPTVVARGGRGLAGGLIPAPPAATPSHTLSIDGARTIWVLRDGVSTSVQIAVGQSDGRYTEVTGGDLREGDHVITDMTGQPS